MTCCPHHNNQTHPHDIIAHGSPLNQKHRLGYVSLSIIRQDYLSSVMKEGILCFVSNKYSKVVLASRVGVLRQVLDGWEVASRRRNCVPRLDTASAAGTRRSSSFFSTRSAASKEQEVILFMRNSTNRTVLMGLLVALSIILTRILSIRIAFGNVEGIRIGFGALPIVITSIFFGSAAGGLVGMLSDIIGYFINPVGPYMPHFTLTSALTGIMPAVVLRLLPGPRFAPWKLALALAVTQVATSVIMVPYFLNILFGLPLSATVPAKLVATVITVPMYSTIIHLLCKPIMRVLHKEE